MVSCKVTPHIRRLGASLVQHARGFCHTVDAGESSSLSLLRLLEKSVEASGKQLVSFFPSSRRCRTSWIRRLRVDKEKAGKVLLQRLEEERQAGKEKGRLLELLVEEKEKRLEEKERLVQAELELRAKDKIELLRARGLNDPRGLFELLQERLAQAVNITAGNKGIDLWEEILTSDAGLAACIERCTKVSAANKSKQALHCYNEHVHAGKQLAHLQDLLIQAT